MSLISYLKKYNHSPNVLNRPYLIAEAGVNHEAVSYTHLTLPTTPYV